MASKGTKQRDEVIEESPADEVIQGDVAPRKRQQQPARTSKYAASEGLKAITVPMTKLNAGDVVAFEFTGETSTRVINKVSKEPATLLRAIDLDTGEVVDVIAGKVMLSSIEEAYPEGVAGKRLLLKASQTPGKNYMSVFISELP